MINFNTGRMNTVFTERLNELMMKEYRLEFRREATCIYCNQIQQWILPDNFRVDEAYYFEDIANPDEDRILYAISLNQDLKGFLIDSCNVYTDNMSPEMMHKLVFNKDQFHNRVFSNGFTVDDTARQSPNQINY